MKKLSLLLFAFALLFGAKAFSQEWEQTIGYFSTDDSCYNYNNLIEFKDGTLGVNSLFYYKSGYGDFYSPQPAVSLISPDGTVLAQNHSCFFRPGYYSSSYSPYLLENEKSEKYALITYSPDHDFTYFNYFKNFDNPPTDAIIALYKLDDNLEIEACYEHSIPIDTFEVKNDDWNVWPNDLSGRIFLHSAIVDDGTIVGSYLKNVSCDNAHPRGHDSLFFFRMSFEGEMLAQKGYEYTTQGGHTEFVFRRNHLMKIDSLFLHYINYDYYSSGTKSDYDHGDHGCVTYLDEDLNIVTTKEFKHFNDHWTNRFYNIAVERSDHNTTYMTTDWFLPNGSDGKVGCCLYELDDAIGNTSSTLPILNFIERHTQEGDQSAGFKGVAKCNDNSLYFAYTLNTGVIYDLDSWMMIEHLDQDFDTICTVYYDLNDGVNIYSTLHDISVTSDGGAVITFKSKNLGSSERWTTVTKFPAEAFLGVEEAHSNGLKLAIAYPNPGHDKLNIRTALPDARVEVYDANGRLVHSQDITENVTSIDAGEWSEGVYVWKVICNDKLAETGKWIKE